MNVKKIAGWSAGMLVGLTLLACGGVDDPTKKSGAGSTAGASAPAPVPSTKRYTPKATDFKMSIKMLDKQCFGSAGCNISFRLVDLKYSGEKLPADETYEISYEIKGLQDPMQGTFEMQGDLSYSVSKEEFGQTKNSKAKPSVTITEISEL